MARSWQRSQESLKIWIKRVQLVGSEECNLNRQQMADF